VKAAFYPLSRSFITVGEASHGKDLLLPHVAATGAHEAYVLERVVRTELAVSEHYRVWSAPSQSLDRHAGMPSQLDFQRLDIFARDVCSQYSDIGSFAATAPRGAIFAIIMVCLLVLTCGRGLQVLLVIAVGFFVAERIRTKSLPRPSDESTSWNGSLSVYSNSYHTACL
jgi:hypothetical protein